MGERLRIVREGSTWHAFVGDHRIAQMHRDEAGDLTFTFHLRDRAWVNVARSFLERAVEDAMRDEADRKRKQ